MSAPILIAIFMLLLAGWLFDRFGIAGKVVSFFLGIAATLGVVFFCAIGIVTLIGMAIREGIF